MSGIVQVISCNKCDCPWHRVTDVGSMSKCENPEAPSSGVARKMDGGVPELCPVKTKGPCLVVVPSPSLGEQMLDDWRVFLRDRLDKSL